MNLRNFTTLALSCLIIAPLAVAAPPKMTKMSKMPTKMTKMPTKMTKMTTKSKMKNLGHGVFMDSAGKYHSADGKFMSKADAMARMKPTGKMTKMTKMPKMTKMSKMPKMAAPKTTK